MFTASVKRIHKRIGRGFLFVPLGVEGKATPGVKVQQGQANGRTFTTAQSRKAVHQSQISWAYP